MKEALYYISLPDNKVRCTLCPHNCLISPGKRGICAVRINKDGVLYTENYGKVTAVAIDPIEKKPLYHFFPGEPILSFGTFGCNFRCPYCQNWEISQTRPDTRNITPEQVLHLCHEYRTELVAFTYNEPMIWYEFVLETAKLLHQNQIKAVLVTNGFINKEPLSDLLPYISAANVDLKSMNGSFYTKLIGGKLNPVLENIKLMHSAKIHIELTTLVIPEYNDSVQEMIQETEWIATNLGPDTPLHLSRYFPHYKMQQYATPMDTLITLYETAKKKLNYVYVGNVWEQKYNNTYCPNCGNLLISRAGYSTKIVGLRENTCTKCGEKIYGVF